MKVGETTMPVVTYKPGWSFRWTREKAGDFLWIRVEGPDAKGWDADTLIKRDVEFCFLIPMPFDPAYLLNRLNGIEDHETREWFRVDGVKVADPHA